MQARQNPLHMLKEWVIFEVSVLPKDAGPVQRREAKRCFFAGALAYHNHMLTNLENGGGDEPTPGDMQRMADLHEEIAGFAMMVAVGIE